MRRRSQVGNVPVKARRRKAAPPKRRNAPKAARRSSSGSKEVEIARLTRELNEARDLNDAKPLFEDVEGIKSDPEMVKLARQLIDRQSARFVPAVETIRNARGRVMPRGPKK